jgi:hypothetical protein
VTTGIGTCSEMLGTGLAADARTGPECRKAMTDSAIAAIATSASTVNFIHFGSVTRGYRERRLLEGTRKS